MTIAEEKNFYSKLGINIRIARQNASMKQETFASFIKLSRSSIVNIEKGRQRISIHTLCEIARILNTSVTALLPVIKSREKLDKTWKTIIESHVHENKDFSKKKSTVKLIHFIEEFQSEKKNRHEGN